MKFTTPCFWDKGDNLTVYSIGRYVHFDTVMADGTAASVVLDIDQLKQLDEALDAHVEAYEEKPEPAPVEPREPRYANLSDQSKVVYRHMDRAGSISAREAMNDYGMTSATLARRICDIEEEGFEIWRERRVHPMTGQRYTRYSLLDRNA